METKLDEFQEGYIACAMWTLDPDPGPGEYDADISQVPEDIKAEMIADCADFLSRANNIGMAAAIEADPKQGGHDFWLTRNRHGCGFWDGGWAEPAGSLLTELAKEFGESDLLPEDLGFTVPEDND